jgi:hypothetical protein
MTDISNKALAFIVGIALIVSLIGLFSLPGGSRITGLGTQGQARINITELAELNVTQALVDFGNGTLENNAINCTLTTEESSGDPRSCWTGTGATDGFHIVNTGNVFLNVTIISTKNKSLDFWGVDGGAYTWRCAGNGTIIQSAYATTRNDTQVRCVANLNSTTGNDEFLLHLNITVPPTALGFKNDTITFTGSKA